jgi:hypothetical protein
MAPSRAHDTGVRRFDGFSMQLMAMDFDHPEREVK